MGTLLTTMRQGDPTLPPFARAEIDIDTATNQLVARVVSTVDGTVVRQYPSEETLHLLARAREQFGRVLKAEV
jgi:uncharacterized FlaG/YvyC family protein